MRKLLVDDLAGATSVPAHRPYFEALEVRYDQVIADGAGRAEEVSRFLGGGLDVEAMAAAVSPELYKGRTWARPEA